MMLRIMVLDLDKDTRDLITTIAQRKGHEVIARTEPSDCLVYTDEGSCDQDLACADLLITSNRLLNMSGPKLFSKQAELGCKCPPQNKLILSTTSRKTREFAFAETLGFKVIMKPFRVSEISNWIDECEKRIEPMQQSH